MTKNISTNQSVHVYDVALSFAGEDRNLAEELASILTGKGVTVFYDNNEQASLWGRDLYQHLQTIYRDKAKYCVIFVSENYAEKLWTKHELKQAQSRAFIENGEYILPIRIDDSELLGLNPTVSYIDIRNTSIATIASLILEKLKKSVETEKIDIKNTKHSKKYLEKMKNEVKSVDERDLGLYYKRAKYLYANSNKKKALQEIEIIINFNPDFYLKVDTDLDLQNDEIKIFLNNLLNNERDELYTCINNQIIQIKNKYKTAIDKDEVDNYLNNKRLENIKKINNMSFLELLKSEPFDFYINDKKWSTKESVERENLIKLKEYEKKKNDEEKKYKIQKKNEIDKLETIKKEKNIKKLRFIFYIIFLILIVCGYLGISIHFSYNYEKIFSQVVYSSLKIGIVIVPIVTMISLSNAEDIVTSIVIGVITSFFLGVIYLLLVGNLLFLNIINNIPYLRS